MKQVPEIMATIGPTLEKPEDLRRAVEAGARWFRLHCGYRQRPHVENARDIRAIAAEVDVPVRLLLDLPSSRQRTGTMKDLQAGGRGPDPLMGFQPPGGTARRSRRGVRPAARTARPARQDRAGPPGMVLRRAPGIRRGRGPRRRSARPIDRRHDSAEVIERDLPARQFQPVHDRHRGRPDAVEWLCPGGHRARLGGAVVDLHAGGGPGGTRADRALPGQGGPRDGEDRDASRRGSGGIDPGGRRRSHGGPGRSWARRAVRRAPRGRGPHRGRGPPRRRSPSSWPRISSSTTPKTASRCAPRSPG